MAKESVNIADILSDIPVPSQDIKEEKEPKRFKVPVKSRRYKKRSVSKSKKPKNGLNKGRPPKPPEKFFKFVDVHKVKEPLKLLDYIRWTAIPRQNRRPQTQSEFASILGVDENTLGRWKWVSGFWDEVASYRESVIRVFATDVFYAIAMNAQGKVVKGAKTLGNSQSQKLFLQAVEGFSEKVRTEDETPIGFLPPEQRKELEEALRASGRSAAIEASTGLRVNFLENKDKEKEHEEEKA